MKILVYKMIHIEIAYSSEELETIYSKYPRVEK